MKNENESFKRGVDIEKTVLVEAISNKSIEIIVFNRSTFGNVDLQ